MADVAHQPQCPRRTNHEATCVCGVPIGRAIGRVFVSLTQAQKLWGDELLGAYVNLGRLTPVTAGYMVLDARLQREARATNGRA